MSAWRIRTSGQANCSKRERAGRGWGRRLSRVRQTLADDGLQADFLVGDARAIPARDAAFDLVMANHMLYEFASDGLRAVVAELNRIVARKGRLLATTYSDAGRVLLTDLHNETLAVLGFPPSGPQPSSFCLENGADVLSAGFAEVDTHVMEEVGSDTDADAFTALYVKTGGYHWAASHDPIPEADGARIPEVFRSKAEERIDEHGAIVTVTNWTAFVARGPL